MVPHPRKTAREYVLNALLMLGSVSLALLAFEGFLSFDNWHPNSSEYMVDVTLNGTTYRLLDAKSAIDDPRRAVLIAGDSFTTGNSCADNRTYPSAFTKAATRSKGDVHAINLGVVGTGPMAYALRAADFFAEKGRTAGLILTLYANDVEIDCFACRHLQSWAKYGDLSAADRQQLTTMCASCLRGGDQQAASAVAGEASLARRFNWWLSERSLSYLVFREAVAKLAVGSGTLQVDWGRAAYPERWRNTDGVFYKYLRGSLEFAKQEADRHQVPVMAVIYPDPVNMTRSNEYVDIYDRVGRSLTASTGVPVLSGYEAFLDNPAAKASMPFSLTDTHPSCEAHDIFGGWVYSQWADVAARHRSTDSTSRRALSAEK
jgi:hypothetical protein